MRKTRAYFEVHGSYLKLERISGFPDRIFAKLDRMFLKYHSLNDRGQTLNYTLNFKEKRTCLASAPTSIRRNTQEAPASGVFLLTSRG